MIERSIPGRLAVGYSTMRAAHLGVPLLVDTPAGRVLLPAFSYTLQLAIQPLQRPRRLVVRAVDPSLLFLLGDPWTPHDRPLTPALRELLLEPAGPVGALCCHEQGLRHGTRVSLHAMLRPRQARGSQGYRGSEDEFPDATLEADPRAGPVLLHELPATAVERLRLLLRKIRGARGE